MPSSSPEREAPPRDDPDASAAETLFTILARLLSNIASLVQVEASSAGREARALAREIARAAALIGVAAFVAFYLIGLLLAAAVLALALVIKPWAAALTVFGATALLMGLLFLVGVLRVRARIRRLGGVIRAFKEDLRWLWTALFRNE